MARREFIFSTLKSIFRKYGYAPIETPAMERLSTLTGKYGEEGDRLIFRVLNNGDFLKDANKAGFDYAAERASQKLIPLVSEKAMRYDLTVPFARLVVTHQHELVFPFRRYQVQPVWRGDSPQAGRYREFYQCDCDVIGSNSLLLDAELAAIYDEAFAALGFPGVSLLLNNRKVLSGMAEVAGDAAWVTNICMAIDKLDKIGEEKVRAELAQRGVPESGITQVFDILAFQGSNAEKLAFLKEKFASSEIGRKGVAEMEEMLGIVDQFGLTCAEPIFDLSLARGLDYYTGTIYEVKAKGIQFGSIGGGGRYDNLTGIFGLPNMSGVGISFGADRIYDVMEKLNLFSDLSQTGTRVLITNLGGESFTASLQLLTRLRKVGVATELFPDQDKLGKQFRYADRKGIAFAVVIGETELAEGKLNLKNMKTGEQQMLTADQLIEFLNA
jgi:histidyl-tRNA synthetase